MMETITLPARLESAKAARDWAAKIASEVWGIDDYVPRLAVTELITNAARHSDKDQPITLCAYERDGWRGIAVHDLCPDLPIIKCPDPAAECGRGLWMLTKLVARLGVHPTLPERPGKAVFVEFHERRSAG